MTSFGEKNIWTYYSKGCKLVLIFLFNFFRQRIFCDRVSLNVGEVKVLKFVFLLLPICSNFRIPEEDLGGTKMTLEYCMILSKMYQWFSFELP